jgi:hypothetical protein
VPPEQRIATFDNDATLWSHSDQRRYGAEAATLTPKMEKSMRHRKSPDDGLQCFSLPDRQLEKEFHMRILLNVVVGQGRSTTYGAGKPTRTP